MLMQEFIFFQLGEVSIGCGSDMSHHMCYVYHDSMLLDEHNPLVSHNNSCFQFVHKFQKLNNDECTFGSQ